jgi:hypothetical protein
MNAVSIAWAVEKAAKYSPVGSTCLASALVAQALFSRHGYDTSLQIGVKRDTHGRFAAHSWLEHEGVVLVGGTKDEIEDYAVLPDIDHLLI